MAVNAMDIATNPTLPHVGTVLATVSGGQSSYQQVISPVRLSYDPDRSNGPASCRGPVTMAGGSARDDQHSGPGPS